MGRTATREPSWTVRVIRFYTEGFRNMTLGRTLWKIIIIKLLIMFGVLKIFFFPDFLDTRFQTDRQRADYVLDQITNPDKGNTTLRRNHR